MGFTPTYSQESVISATWNLADVTFSTASFDFNSLTATVIIDNTTTLSEISIATPVYTAVPEVAIPTYSEVQYG
tara:strand:- start:4320 stop:4541 length:222 start_codon:yes stop_codon:yes gene_type:complete